MSANRQVKEHVCKPVVLTKTWETQDASANFFHGPAPILKHSTEVLVCKVCGRKLASA